MSNHVSKSRSVSIYKGHAIYSKTGERDDTNRYIFDFYCKCGFIGGLIIETPYNEYFRPTPTCPCCKKESDVPINIQNFDSNAFVDYTKIWDNDDKVRFQLAFTRIFQNKHSGHLFSKKERFSFCYNTVSKNMYFTYGKKVINWSYATTSIVNKRSVDTFLNLIRNCDRTREHFVSFLRLCYSKINIRFANTESIFEYVKDIPELSSVRNAFTLLKFPFLENIQLQDDLQYCESIIPHSVRKKLREVEDNRSFFQNVFLLDNKKAIKHFYNNGFRHETVFLNQLINNNNLDYFWDKYTENFGISTSVRNSSLLNHWNFAPFTARHALKKGLDLTPFEVSFLAFEMFRSFYKKDKPFIDSILKNKRKMKISFLEKIGDDMYRLRTKEYYSPVQWYQIKNILSDAYTMKIDIDAYLPDTSIKFEGNIFKYHDELSREHRRIQKNISDFLYSDEEKYHYNSRLGNLDFRLLNSSKEYIETGIKMNNCVGGYVDNGVERDCYIVVAYNNDYPVACLELAIVNDKVYCAQAYGHSNKHLDADTAIVVADYLLSKGVSFPNCPELIHALPDDYAHETNNLTPSPSKAGCVELTEIDESETIEEVNFEKYGEFARFPHQYYDIKSFKETETIMIYDEILYEGIIDFLYTPTPDPFEEFFDADCDGYLDEYLEAPIEDLLDEEDLQVFSRTPLPF